MEFTLFKKLADLPLVTIITLLVAAAMVITLVVLLVRAHKQPRARLSRHDATRALAYGALCVALSFMLSYLRLFKMPQGGSITVCSILPLAIYANWFGVRKGLLAGFVCGLLQFLQEPVMVHWAQPLLDYPLAFACFGLAGLFPKNLPVGILVGGIGRILFSTISGAIFFAEYAWAGYNIWVYSIIYNTISLGPDALICLVVAVVPPVAKLIRRLAPKVSKGAAVAA